VTFILGVNDCLGGVDAKEAEYSLKALGWEELRL